MRIIADSKVGLAYAVGLCLTAISIATIYIGEATPIPQDNLVHDLHELACQSQGNASILVKPKGNVDDPKLCPVQADSNISAIFTPPEDDSFSGRQLKAFLDIGKNSHLRVHDGNEIHIEFQSELVQIDRQSGEAVTVIPRAHGVQILHCNTRQEICESQDFLKFSLKWEKKYKLVLSLLSITDAKGKSLSHPSENDLRVGLRTYNTHDKSQIRLVKTISFVMCLIGFIIFTRSLRNERLQDKLTVQMFVKYFGFVINICNLPFFLNSDRTGPIGVILLFFDSLLYGYLMMFFLIILPSVATEASVFITAHNKGWKKFFLLVSFVVFFSLRVAYFYQYEEEGLARSYSRGVKYLEICQRVLVVYCAVYSTFWTLKILRKWSSLEDRYHTFCALTFGTLIGFFYIHLLSISTLERSPDLTALRTLLIPTYVFSLEMFFRKIGESGKSSIENMQKPSAGQHSNHHIEYANPYAHQVSMEDVKSGDVTQENDSIDLQMKKQAEKDAQHHHEPREEISYELENEH